MMKEITFLKPSIGLGFAPFIRTQKEMGRQLLFLFFSQANCSKNHSILDIFFSIGYAYFEN